MKAKTYLSALFGIIAIALVIGSVSAFSFDSPSGRLSLNNNITIGFNADANQNYTFTPSSSAFTVSPASFSSTDSLKTITLKLSASQLSGLSFGTYTYQINASNGTSSVNQDITLVKGFCSNGAVGKNLSITDVDISNSGDKDETWKPLDTITIEVDVKAENDDVDDVVVELAVFDSSGNDVTTDLDFISSDEEKYDMGNLDKNDKDTATFEFRVPADMDTGSYSIQIKAYSDDLGESSQCTDSSVQTKAAQSVKVESEDDEGKFIAFDNVKFSPTEATCGESIVVSFEAFNVGENDEDQVKINLVSKELGVDLSQEIKSGLDRGDSKKMEFTFNIPAGVANKVYALELSAEYDYNSRNDLYREESDEPLRIPLNVLGCSVSQTDKISIGSTLESEVVSGKDVTIKARITNLDSKAQTLIISASGYSEFASNVAITPQTVDLRAGESKDVSLVLSLKSGISGDKTFQVVAQNSETMVSKNVALSVPASSNWLVDNWLIWVIGAVNLVLILVIILVAIRVSRR